MTSASSSDLSPAVRVLSGISLSMGLCLLAPTLAGRLFGLGDRPNLVRAIAIRDVIIGIGLLSGRDRPLWLRVHTAANLLDATGVSFGLMRGAVAPVTGTA